MNAPIKSAVLAVLSSTLDLLDLSEPSEQRNNKDRKSPGSSRSDKQNSPQKKKIAETELIQVEVEQSMRTPERASLDSGTGVMQTC